MVLTKEDRIELLKKARQAKASKRASAKEDEEETPVVNVPEPEPEPPTPKVKKTRKPKELPVPVEEVVEVVEEEPLPVPKKKAVASLPSKWLKNPKTEPEKVCCNAKLTKEEPLITDDKPQVVADKIVIPPKKELVKKRTPRASTPSRKLELSPPRDIVEVIEELQQDNTKYRPPQKRQQAPPPQSAPISIVRAEPALRLFDY